MSWQEKIGRYKQEQIRTQNETQKRVTEEQEQQRREKVEKIKPLLQVLEDLRCREILTQIRDEVWKLGEVSVSPDLNEVTHNAPIEAKVVLRAEWPFVGEVDEIRGSPTEEYSIKKEKELIGVIILEVKIFYKEKDFEISMGEKHAKVDQNISVWLEKVLIEDCAKRSVPYDKEAKKAQVELERWKRKH